MLRHLKIALCIVLPLTTMSSIAQKRVLSYPFEFEKSFLAKGNYDCYFLDNPAESNFSLILKDNKKIEYILIDKNFKVISKFNLPIGNTVFDIKNLRDCTGGTSRTHQYHFLYPESKTEFQMETVDFDTKTATHQKILELAKDEHTLVSFSDNNVFYVLATNDKTKSLAISTVDATGKLQQKNLAFPIPPDASKDRSKLSEYLKGMKVIKGNEYPDMSIAVKSAKLFTSPEKLTMVINDGDNPAHIVTLSLPDLSLQEQKIDYSAMIGKDEKGKVYISSYLKDDRLFSLVLNKKNIRIVIDDARSGAMLGKLEINDNQALDLFADGPTTETRMGKRESGKPIEDVRKLIKALTNGTEGLLVTENNKGQFIVTVGTYDMIPMSTGGSGPSFTGGFERNPLYNPNNLASTIMVWNPYMYYRPGFPSYTLKDARYYKTTFFKVLLDPATYKITHGRVPMPASEQIKDYMETISKKNNATNQFAIGKTQYYGYYDRDALSYVVEQIRLIQ